jgi:tetratricopeptide (TPR) repeat protein
VAAADPTQGKAAFDEGQRRFLAGDYREALTWFKKGYLATDDVAFLLNIAQCQRFLGETKEALMMYKVFLKSTPEWANREARAAATRAIRELEVEAVATPPLASSSATPSPALTAAEPAAPIAENSGRKSQQASGGFPVLEPVPELDAKRAPALTPQPADNTESTAHRLHLAGLVCGATGLVSLGAGFYYWTRATSLSDSANTAAIYHQADYDHGQRAETMQWIFYSVGAAAIATGTALYVYDRWRPAATKSTVGLAPMVGPGAAGLEAHGAF